MTGVLRALYFACVACVALVVGYKVYIDVFDSKLESVHAAQVEAIQMILGESEAFEFAVVGNINNSIGIFERQIVPRLNASGAAFVVSTGNAVTDGGEDKYRSLRGSLSRLEIPFLLTFGDNEARGLGAFRFYRHFGPYFFSFRAGNARFVFLDTTGQTSTEWQLRWLEEELARERPLHTFVFAARPPLRPTEEPMLTGDDDYLGPPEFRQALLDLLDRHAVDAIFSDSLPIFDLQTRGATRYVTTGGGGGLVVSDESSFHHFVTVRVAGGQVSIQAHPLDVGQHRLQTTLESLWLFIHSLFFVGYLNFLLLVASLVLVAVHLHGLVFVEKDYYPRFDLDPAPFLHKPLRVAMFTNSSLPFIGGVPISIDRLMTGLRRLGASVLLVAPRYERREDRSEEPDVLRVPVLAGLGLAAGLPIANIFRPSTAARVRAFAPDIVHLHHPFWMGSLGLFIARRLGIPAIYTYHTRFEHFAHYVPVPGRLFRNLISHYMIKRFANMCFGVIVPTPSAREYLHVLGVKSRVIVQPTGVDLDALREVRPAERDELRRALDLGDEAVLISVSRLSREKNLDFLLRAFRLVVERSARPVRLVIVGEGQERPALEALVDELGLRGRVSLPGAFPVERMPVVYSLGDLFVFASTSETQGMVIVEAMAAGLPVVAIRASGIEDLVQDGHNGFKTRGDPSEWADRVLELLEDDALRGRLAQGAASSAEGLGIEPFAREILRFYAEALASCAASRGPSRHTT